jgi:DNA-binding transcriptional MerR regulator
MRIGELACGPGLSISCIRYYGLRKLLLFVRRETSDYRSYSEKAEMAFNTSIVRSAWGFSLAEIRSAILIHI